jgi:hypothetical protein
MSTEPVLKRSDIFPIGEPFHSSSLSPFMTISRKARTWASSWRPLGWRRAML